MNPTLLLNTFVTKLINKKINWTQVWTTNPTTLSEYVVRKQTHNNPTNYPDLLLDKYKDQIFLTLKLENFNTYYIHFTSKNIKHTKALQLSSVLICRKLLAKGVAVEKKLKLNKFKDEQSLVDYLYNKVYVENINLSTDDNTLLEDI